MPNHGKCSHPWTVHTSRLLISKNSIKNVLENLFLMFGRGKTQNRAKTHRPSMSAFSAIFVLKENGTQSHSAKFLNWGDHVNSVPDLAASPPWTGTCDWKRDRKCTTWRMRRRFAVVLLPPLRHRALCFTRHGGFAISLQNNLELHFGGHTCWLRYFTLVCPRCRRTGVRSVYCHVITKFSPMGKFT